MQAVLRAQTQASATLLNIMVHDSAAISALAPGYAAAKSSLAAAAAHVQLAQGARRDAALPTATPSLYALLTGERERASTSASTASTATASGLSASSNAGGVSDHNSSSSRSSGNSNNKGSSESLTGTESGSAAHVKPTVVSQQARSIHYYTRTT